MKHKHIACNMNLEFEKLGDDRAIRSPDLRNRAELNPWTDNRLQYLVRKNGIEVAFLSFDLYLDQSFIALYELFVAKKYRRQGIRSALIQESEKIATANGSKFLLVRPEPLSKDFSKDELISWYKKLGFSEKYDEPGIFQKELY